MIRRDYHMHTTYCDGVNTAEEMIVAAIGFDLQEIGFSGHSHTPFDESYCMSLKSMEDYRKELLRLREKYARQISVRIGLEMDLYSDVDTEGFDYLIGSAHYVRVRPEGGAAKPEELPEGCLLYDGGGDPWIYIPVDETPQILRAAAEAFFGGDPIRLAELYFETAGGVAEATGCDIIGHFDLITKFNEKDRLFDTEDPRYIRAWQRAADRLLKAGVPFEINTGAMSKGYRTSPYPSKPIRDYIRGRGGRLILSSDSHRKETLCYAFEKYEEETL